MTRATGRLLAALSLEFAGAVTLPAQQTLWTRYGYYGPGNTPGFGFRDVLDDVDGDGVRDVLADSDVYSQTNASGGVLSAAGVIVVLSGATGATIRQHNGTAAYEGLHACGSVGDTDADGFGDYLTTSAVYGYRIVSGATGVFGPSLPIYCAYNPEPLGDINGDGFGDFIAGGGSCVFAALGPNATAVYTVCAGVGTITGWDMANVGDIDGDGVQDFVVGSPTPYPGQILNYSGSARLVSGASGTILHTWSQGGFQDRFGESVSAIGDVTGDGIPEVVIGAPSLTSAYVYTCDAAGALVYTLTSAVPYGTYPLFARLSASIGDFDGDGWQDYLLSAYLTPAGIRSGPTGALIHSIPSPPLFGIIGYEAAGDIDADGYTDLFVRYGPVSGAQPYAPATAAISLRPVGATFLGAACPDFAGRLPRLAIDRPATSGQTCRVSLSLTTPATSAGLILGLSTVVYGQLSLPADLGPAGLPGCQLLTSLDYFSPAVTAAAEGGLGAAQQAFVIPVGLVGTKFAAQWLIENPPGAAAPACLTRGLRVTIQ